MFLCAATASGQAADVATIDQSKTLPHLNSEIIAPALKTVTGNHLVSVDGQKQKYIVGTATNGLLFEIRFHGCSKDKTVKCKAMSLTSTWGKLKKSKAKKLGTQISKFLLSHPLANAGFLEDGSPYISRYVIADYGTPQGNVVSEIANFIRAATEFSVLLHQQAAK